MSTEESKKISVGLVMPIAAIDGCSTEHWIDVQGIISESISTLNDYSEPKLVSDGNSIGLIHKRIVEGLYKSDIIICDVSCKNPNVMFELGMRLAFDKPTVIIKDDKTDYSFDTGVIEHIPYPRDLSYKEIVNFKEKLALKVRSTYEDSVGNPDHSPFLKSYGTFKAASITETTVPTDQYIIDVLSELQNDVSVIKSSMNRQSQLVQRNAKKDLERLIMKSMKNYVDKFMNNGSENNRVEQEEIANFVYLEFKEQGINVPKKLIEEEIDRIVEENDLGYTG